MGHLSLAGTSKTFNKMANFFIIYKRIMLTSITTNVSYIYVQLFFIKKQRKKETLEEKDTIQW